MAIMTILFIHVFAIKQVTILLNWKKNKTVCTILFISKNKKWRVLNNNSLLHIAIGINIYFSRPFFSVTFKNLKQAKTEK
jgi:hypothetical protein